MQRSEPYSIAAYTCILLLQGRYCLLLQRATQKTFGGQWTGLGGRVEPHEFGDLYTAAWRELAEEAKVTPEHVKGLCLRRIVLQARSAEPLTLLCYFTGLLQTLPPSLPSPPDNDALVPAAVMGEGTIFWASTALLESLPLIDNTRITFPLLLTDLARDPVGVEPVRLGIATSHPDGRLTIHWG